jgi:hypothetical protein
MSFSPLYSQNSSELSLEDNLHSLLHSAIDQTEILVLETDLLLNSVKEGKVSNRELQATLERILIDAMRSGQLMVKSKKSPAQIKRLIAKKRHKKLAIGVAIAAVFLVVFVP